jgi:DNA-directed RNA polymerase subunit RPC12/RpoP
MRWKKTNAEWLKLRRTLLRYNLTLDQYYAMEDSQDFVCAICGEENAFHVDHNHTTNKVRGLLCPWCNNGLGNYKDDPRKLRSAAQYLEER